MVGALVLMALEVEADTLKEEVVLFANYVKSLGTLLKDVGIALSSPSCHSKMLSSGLLLNNHISLTYLAHCLHQPTLLIPEELPVITPHLSSEEFPATTLHPSSILTLHHPGIQIQGPHITSLMTLLISILPLSIMEVLHFTLVIILELKLLMLVPQLCIVPHIPHLLVFSSSKISCMCQIFQKIFSVSLTLLRIIMCFLSFILPFAL